MSNQTQLLLTITTFVLGTITFGTNYIRPIYEKVDSVNERLYIVESQLKVHNLNLTPKQNGK